MSRKYSLAIDKYQKKIRLILALKKQVDSECKECQECKKLGLKGCTYHINKIIRAKAL